MSHYTPPSKCQQCVPIETLTTNSSISWTTELAHETRCLNNTRKDPAK